MYGPTRLILLLTLCLPAMAQSSSPVLSCPDPTAPDCGAGAATQTNALPPVTTPPIGSAAGDIGQEQQRPDQNTQLYVDSAGTSERRQTEQNRLYGFLSTEPLTDMQRLAQASTGENLPIFGRDLFQRAPTTFAPADQIPALADYIVGPGDQLLVRLWGPESFNGQLTVDSTGSIYIPRVGAIHVAGLRVDELEKQISSEVRHTYRNFNLSVNLGHLRSIQVYVVGEARRPGAYTVSSLSTVLNVLFVSGGPSVQGSLRHIQVRRGGKVVSELDLYSLLLTGDKSQDVRLEPDDTIFIPSVGSQVAIAGSVHHPAVYELRDDTTIDALLKLAGGFSSTASTTQISLERIEQQHDRAAMTVNLDAAGRGTVLRDGDVLYAGHITRAYEKSVTIRGNLANPGRFAWRPGMRLTDIIPDRMSLLTNNYWQQRNKLGLPTPLFEPMPPARRSGSLPYGYGQGNRAGTQGNVLLSTPLRPQVQQQYTPANSDPLDPYQSLDPNAAISNDVSPSQSMGYEQTPQNGTNAELGNNGQGESLINPSDRTLTRGSLADEQQSVSSRTIASQGKRNEIQIPAPEIDWSYAVIQRLDPSTLKSSLVPFNLQRLLQDHDSTQNFELQPGDIVTILSQADVHVPQDEQTKFVRLEGEFKGAGVYSVSPNETLYDLVQRAGGLTGKAYLYGASFTRETARVFQQQRLDEYISQVAINMQRAAAVRTASSSTGVSDPNILLEQREAINQLRRLRATGRVVLEFQPGSTGIESIPHIPLEDGDIFRIPSRPLTVNVIGAVYGQNVFLFDPKRRVEDYLLLAGKPTAIADARHAFVIRADGSVYSRDRARGPWKNSFDATQINPGDSIVVPEKPVGPSFVRQFIDYSQIFSQFALGAAAISVIKQ